MTDEQIVRIQEELMSSIQSDIDIEDLIKNTAKEIAAHLVFEDNTSAEFMTKLYKFKYQKFLIPGSKQCIKMLVADMANYQQFGTAYCPYTVTVEIDNNFTFRENMQAIVEAFFRHITNRTQAEILE